MFTDEAVDELRRETKYNPRKRVATAHRLLCVCVEACLFGKTLGFAVIRSFFVKRFGAIRPRAFQLRFKSAAAAAFFRGALERVVKQTIHETVPGLTLAMAPFTDVIVYDGTGQRAPRRGRTQGLRGCTEHAAGSKWVIGYSLRSGMILDATMGAATESEITLWRQGATPLQSGALYLLDLGYFARTTFEQAQARGAHVLMRLKADQNLRSKLRVLGGREHNEPWTPRRQTTVASYVRRAKRQRLTTVDVDVEWGIGRKALPLRVVGVRRKKDWFLYLTTVGHTMMTPETVSATYRLRWLIEFLFREWKQQADWGRSVTADKHALEALTCAALLTHALVRSLRVAGAYRREVPLDTLRPLACLHAVRPYATELVTAMGRPDDWQAITERIIDTMMVIAYEPKPSRSRPRIARNLGALGG